MPAGRNYRLEFAYLGTALAVALLVQRADLGRPAPDVAVPVVALRAPAPAPEENFRLAPDRRFLLAVGELHRLVTAAPARAADARLDGALWHVSYDGGELGTLSEYPDYPELLAMLEACATRLQVGQVIDAPGITGDLAPLEAELREPQALRAASLADRRWSVGERGRGLFQLGTRALILLELERTDALEASDRLAARALALTAACRSLDSAALERESCLLAYHLGYRASARALADRYSPYDPVRAYVRDDDARLAALALQRRASPETRFLYRVRSRAADDEPPAPLTVLLAVERDLAEMGGIPAGDSAGARSGPAGEEARLSDVTNAFERRMEALSPQADGVFLDRELLAGTWRGGFYSALLNALELPDGSTAPASEAAAPARADPLAGVRSGPAAEFAAWARHVRAAGSSPERRSALIADLGALPQFGAPLRFAAYQALCGESPATELAPRRAAQQLVQGLDTRPAHRARLGRIAILNLLALPLGEELLASAARAGAPLDCELEAWWCERNGDRARLESMLSRPGLGWAQQAAILGHYQTVAERDSAAVCRAYRRCIGSHPGSWRLLAGYTGYLERQRAWAGARSMIHGWLDRNADRAGLDGITARTMLGRLYEDQGRYAEGFAAVASAVASQQPEAMTCAARLLEALGRTSQAETLAVFAAEREPAPGEAELLAAELLWRHGKPGAAAHLLAARGHLGARERWRLRLGPRFSRCFAARPALGQAAADSLLSTGRIRAESVSELAAAAADSGAWALALEVESRVRPVPARRSEHVVNLYRYRERCRGEADAAAWIVPRLANAGPVELAWIEHRAFALEDDRLLWSVCSDSSGAGAEYPWLLRAAAALRRGDHGGPHARELAWHFAAPERGHDRMLGRFVLGLEDESTVRALSQAGGAPEACEAYYFLGFKAQAEGRTTEAAAWYARALGTQQIARPEYRWACDQLLEWRRQGQSLERLEATLRRTPA